VFIQGREEEERERGARPREGKAFERRPDLPEKGMELMLILSNTSRHLRALLSVCGRCSLGVWGVVLVVCVSVLFSVGVCVCVTC